jgi:hypothetical protein
VVNEQKRSERLVELNVVEQVQLVQTTIVRDAWDRGQDLTIHGWVYGINDGKLQDMGIAVSALDQLAPAVAAAPRSTRPLAGAVASGKPLRRFLICALCRRICKCISKLLV